MIKFLCQLVILIKTFIPTRDINLISKEHKVYAARIDQSYFKVELIFTLGTNLKNKIVKTPVLQTLPQNSIHESDLEQELKNIMREKDY